MKEHMMSIEETQQLTQTLNEANECLDSPYLKPDQEETLRPLVDLLVNELIFYGNNDAFEEVKHGK